MANTFLAAKGNNMGKSKIEGDKLALARSILEKARDGKVEVLLPVDVVVAESLDAASGKVVDANAVPDDMMALDIGPKTVELFSKRFFRLKNGFLERTDGPVRTQKFFRTAPSASQKHSQIAARSSWSAVATARSSQRSGRRREIENGHVSDGRRRFARIDRGEEIAGHRGSSNGRAVVTDRLRKPLIAGNWKMFHAGLSGLELAGECAKIAARSRDVEIVIAPPFTVLAAAASEIEETGLEIAGQNLAPGTTGAFTGEVSGGMLREADARGSSSATANAELVRRDRRARAQKSRRRVRR